MRIFVCSATVKRSVRFKDAARNDCAACNVLDSPVPGPGGIGLQRHHNQHSRLAGPAGGLGLYHGRVPLLLHSGMRTIGHRAADHHIRR